MVAIIATPIFRQFLNYKTSIHCLTQYLFEISSALQRKSEQTPDVIHFSADLPLTDPLFITKKLSQWVVTAQALIHTGHHLAMETQ